ncbi:vitelline membrane outer layer protein 1 homolog [Ruditapes philippinarum]|uniref:vitelline membrane outer layer protein 1 homolog n=1 Tax=Ruditapes philippinarum TaxID=129788 RepID=UPI00295A7F31|nr:vitelline membrane outer layer protein 1 homolog [Ruditapes philippinarum]
MEHKLAVISFLSILAFTNGFTILSVDNGDTGGTWHTWQSCPLSVDNGETGGTWHTWQSCPLGSFAVGFGLKYAVLSAFKIEDYQEFPHDNTALNGIRLICKNTNGTIVDRNVTSKVGPFGKWVGETVCEKINGVQLYLTSFALQVHRIPNQTELEALSLSEVLNGNDDLYDNTAVNYVKFKCRDLAGNQPSRDLIKVPRRGKMGQYGNWSPECPASTAFRVLSTRVDNYEYRNFVDDTAINDIKFYCDNGEF